MMKTGILFCGFRHSHINSLYQKVSASPLAEIVGCVEENEAARRQASETLGAVFTQRSYESWLEDPRVTAVAIGNAYGHRGDAIIKALRAGKHVIADKPICTELSQLKTVRALSEKKGLVVGCMLDLRYLPQTQRALALLKSSRLGKIRNITFNGQHCLDYGSRPGWYFEPGLHGGTVNDIAIHGIDLVRLLTGEEFAGIDGARTWNAYANRHPHFMDSACFLARLEGGAGVMADVSYAAPKTGYTLPSYWEFRVWCDNGMLQFNFAESTVTVHEAGAAEAQTFAGIAPHEDYLQEFIRQIQTGSREMTENILRSTQTALEIQRAAQEG